MLIIHFLGVAMGVGTSIAFAILGASANKMEKKEGSDNEEIQAETPQDLKEMKFENVDSKKKASTNDDGEESDNTDTSEALEKLIKAKV